MSDFLKKYFGFIIIILFGVIVLFDFFSPGLPITHDGQDHVARIANFYQSLSEGNLIPRWAGNLNWGYGHPILMFLYPFPSYLTSLFHFIGFNFVDSVKLTFGLTFILSGIAMYLWAKEFLGQKAGIIAGLFYMIAPYRFVDLYVRGAIGEHVAFLFIPLVLYFLLKLSIKYSYWYMIGASVSLAGLLLSHNAISIMFLPFILFYGVYLFLSQKKRTRRLLFNYGIVLVLGFCFSAFFIIPAFFEGKYTLRDIVTGKNEYVSSFVDPIRFLYGKWSYGGTLEFTKEIGIVHILGILLSVMFIIKEKKKSFKIFYSAVFLYFLGSLFIITKESQFIWQIVSLLQKFQFPWRFLSITVFTSALLSAIGIFLIKKRNVQNVLFFIFLSALFIYSGYWHANGYLQKNESFFTGIYNSTTDTGESAPRWSTRFMEKRPGDTIQVIAGDAHIQKIARTSNRHEYKITASQNSRIKDNTVYFPGWNVYLNNTPLEIQFQDPSQRGLITFEVPKGVHSLVIIFEDTKIRMIANIISLCSVIGVIMGGILLSTKKYTK